MGKCQALHDAIKHARQGASTRNIFEIGAYRQVLGKMAHRVLKEGDRPLLMVLAACSYLLTVPTQPFLEALRTCQKLLCPGARCHKLTIRQRDLGKTTHCLFKRIEKFSDTLRHVLEGRITFAMPRLTFERATIA